MPYTQIEYTSGPSDGPSNAKEVKAFVGEVPPCSVCGDSGEFDGEYGIEGCPTCCSRLIPFIDFEGHRGCIDWGDTVTRHKDGLRLITKRSKEDSKKAKKIDGYKKGDVVRVAPENLKGIVVGFRGPLHIHVICLDGMNCLATVQNVESISDLNIFDMLKDQGII